MKKYCPVPRSKPVTLVHYPTYEYRSVKKEVDGIVKTLYEKVEIDPLKVNEGLKASDFSLDVLIEQGAIDLLRESSIISQSPTQVLDTFNNL